MVMFPNEANDFYCLQCLEPCSALSLLVGNHTNHPRRTLNEAFATAPTDLLREASEFRNCARSLSKCITNAAIARAEAERCMFSEVDRIDHEIASLMKRRGEVVQLLEDSRFEAEEESTANRSRCTQVREAGERILRAADAWREMYENSIYAGVSRGEDYGREQMSKRVPKSNKVNTNQSADSESGSVHHQLSSDDADGRQARHDGKIRTAAQVAPPSYEDDLATVRREVHAIMKTLEEPLIHSLPPRATFTVVSRSQADRDQLLASEVPSRSLDSKTPAGAAAHRGGVFDGLQRHPSTTASSVEELPTSEDSDSSVGVKAARHVKKSADGAYCKKRDVTATRHRSGDTTRGQSAVAAEFERIASLLQRSRQFGTAQS